MTVIFSKKCEYGMQAVLYLAAQDVGTIISKILQSLRESGIISSTKGKSGGFCLAKPSSEIKLIDVVEAIDGLEMFDSCVLGFPECSPDTPCPMHDKWGILRTQALEMLTSETLDKLKDRTLKKILTL